MKGVCVCVHQGDLSTMSTEEVRFSLGNSPHSHQRLSSNSLSLSLGRTLGRGRVGWRAHRALQFHAAPIAGVLILHLLILGLKGGNLVFQVARIARLLLLLLPSRRRLACSLRPHRRPLEHDEPRGHVLVDRLADDLVLPLEVVDAVLLVREPPAALRAHESVLLPTLVLEVSVQVVVPVVGSLEEKTVSWAAGACNRG